MGKDSYKRRQQRKYIEENDDIPVKLVEPTAGNVLKLHVTENDPEFLEVYMDQLETYARALIKINLTGRYEISKDTLTVYLPEAIAGIQKDIWRKWHNQ